MNKPRIHYTASYLLAPTNPITINLIGAGGTGSQVLTALSRINTALLALEHPGLYVTVWDDDTVSEANLGRQLFSSAEVGLPKAVALINRTNRFFGTNWKAITKRYGKSRTRTFPHAANLTISCVDTVSARLSVAASLLAHTIDNRNIPQTGPEKAYYWMDFGNSQKSGQVLLSTVGTHTQPTSEKNTPVAAMPFVTDEYGDTLTASEDGDDTPSCSLAQALTRQDLFINTTLANMGCGLLWNLLRNGMTPNRGLFLNLADLRSVPVSV